MRCQVTRLSPWEDLLYFIFLALYLFFLVNLFHAAFRCFRFSINMLSSLLILILFQDSSPCYQVTCPFYGTCRLKKNGTLFCECVSSCPKIYKPVCGSDGMSYFSECFLQSNSCLLSQQITVEHPGHCSKFVYLIAFHSYCTFESQLSLFLADLLTCLYPLIFELKVRSFQSRSMAEVWLAAGSELFCLRSSQII